MNVPATFARSPIVAVIATTLVACVATPHRPDGAASLRTRLTALQTDPERAHRAPVATEEAEAAVVDAERRHADKAVAAHLIYMADRKISIAEAQADTSLAMDERTMLGEERHAMRLQPDTGTAAFAARRAAGAQAEADEQKRELEEMRNVNADARLNAQQLQRQIDALQADVVDRGLLLTLDDALFAGNAARLNAGGSARLDKLVSFLKDYPHRSAQIESSAVCTASAGYDATLSQGRAEAVASYLIQRGIAAARLSARSNKASSSVDADCDAHSLHQNRQVIVIIEDVLTSAR